MLVLDLTVTMGVLVSMWLVTIVTFLLAVAIMKGQGKPVDKPIGVAMLLIMALLFVGMLAVRVYGAIEVSAIRPIPEVVGCTVIQVDPVKGDLIKCDFRIKVHFKEP